MPSTDSVAAPLLITFSPSGRRLTAADLACLPRELPSGSVDFELVDGMLLVRGPARLRESNVQMNVWKVLFPHAEQRGRGKTLLRVGIVLRRNPDTVLGPCVPFWTTERLPLEDSPERYVATVPDMVVEIASQCPSPYTPEQRTQDYLRAGVRVVWLVDNEARTVTASRPDVDVQTLSEKDVLRAEEIIPGMELRVASLFAS